jgi:hypothetical protein
MPRWRDHPLHLLVFSSALALALLAAGCGRDRPATGQGAAREPAEEVLVLAAHLRENDLQGFLRAAVPPALQSPLAQAWREGRSRWPLEELPFDHKLPTMLDTLAAEGADKRLRRDFDRQFANAGSEIRSAANSLGLFGVKFVENDRALSDNERAHYSQLIRALSDWAQTAKLGDPQRARRSISQLTAAARQTGLRSDEDFTRLGMDRSLARLGPFFGSVKSVLLQYGLDLDKSLDAMQAELVSRQGDVARVRVRYPLAKAEIDTIVELEQVDGRWYLRDYLDHARAAAASASPQLPAMAPTPLPADGAGPTSAPAEGAKTPTEPAQPAAATSS